MVCVNIKEYNAMSASKHFYLFFDLFRHWLLSTAKYTSQHEQFSKLRTFFLKIQYILKTTNKILNGTFVEIHKHFLKAWRFYKVRYFFNLFTILENGNIFWTYRRNLENVSFNAKNIFNFLNISLKEEYFSNL